MKLNGRAWHTYLLYRSCAALLSFEFVEAHLKDFLMIVLARGRFDTAVFMALQRTASGVESALSIPISAWLNAALSNPGEDTL